jgi:hypothetical protein
MLCFAVIIREAVVTWVLGKITGQEKKPWGEKQALVLNGANNSHCDALYDKEKCEAMGSWSLSFCLYFAR